MKKIKTTEKPREWANLQQQLREIRDESFKQGVWEGERKDRLSKINDEIEFIKESFTIFSLDCSQCIQSKVLIKDRLTSLQSEKLKIEEVLK